MNHQSEKKQKSVLPDGVTSRKRPRKPRQVHKFNF